MRLFLHPQTDNIPHLEILQEEIISQTAVTEHLLLQVMEMG
jgi:hypothetical protein